MPERFSSARHAAEHVLDRQREINLLMDFNLREIHNSVELGQFVCNLGPRHIEDWICLSGKGSGKIDNGYSMALAYFGHTAAFGSPSGAAQRRAVPHNGRCSHFLAEKNHRFNHRGMGGYRPLRSVAAQHIRFEKSAITRLDKRSQSSQMAQNTPHRGQHSI